MSAKMSAKRETNKQDVKCLYEELLKNATPEAKEKMLLAMTGFLLGVQNKD